MYRWSLQQGKLDILFYLFLSLSVDFRFKVLHGHEIVADQRAVANLQDTDSSLVHPMSDVVYNGHLSSVEVSCTF
jgi:hypothetical protein